MMHSPQQITIDDYLQACALRDMGMQITESRHGKWVGDAMRELEVIWRRRCHEPNAFTFEMLKFSVRRVCGQESSSAIWGVLARRMVKNGWIKCIGTCNAQSIQAHGSLRRKYQWCVP